jgi:hypothetical protein
MDTPSTPELLALLEAWLRLHAPGLLPSHFTVHFFNAQASLQLPFAPTVSVPQPEPRPPPKPARERRLSPCAVDIIIVLKKAGHPLTTMRILAELARAGKEWSQRHAAGILASMVRDGTLLNPPGARPAGYRLPEWGSTETTGEKGPSRGSADK